MQPGTIGVWDGERWKPHERDDGRCAACERPLDMGAEAILGISLAAVLRQLIRVEVASEMAAALADPNLGDEAAHLYEEGQDHDAFRSASKALAGYLLERVTETKAGA